MLDYARGFLLILAFQMLGLGLHRLGIPIPGGVLGLLAFYAALETGLVRAAWVERAAGLLLRHMVLLFVPLAVALVWMGPLLQRNAVAILASLLVSWAAVLLTTGLLGKWLLRPDAGQVAGPDAAPVAGSGEAGQ